ncbi:unnamed protein product, partial [Cylicostephanus goldi]
MWLAYALLLTVAISMPQSPNTPSSTSAPKKTKFSVGKRLCKPRFSEISTLYVGVNAQDNLNEFDEFIEIDFPQKECEKVRRLVIHQYTIIVIDTRPIYSTSAGPLFLCRLHSSAMKTGEFYFVIGNQSDNTPAPREFDILYTHERGDSNVNGISYLKFTATHFAAEPEDKTEFPVIFILAESPALRSDENDFKKLVAEVSYAQVGRSRKVTILEQSKTLSHPSSWKVMFENAVDVVVVNRNVRSTRTNLFTAEMFKAFDVYGIRPSMLALDVSRETRDLPRGRSISLCIPPNELLSYTTSHTSVYWKSSIHTPGYENDCSLPEYLRIFDETTGYSPRIPQYQYQEPFREEAPEAVPELVGDSDDNMEVEHEQGEAPPTPVAPSV